MRGLHANGKFRALETLLDFVMITDKICLLRKLSSPMPFDIIVLAILSGKALKYTTFISVKQRFSRCIGPNFIYFVLCIQAVLTSSRMFSIMRCRTRYNCHDIWFYCCFEISLCVAGILKYVGKQ